jgi:hypothetical protein
MATYTYEERQKFKTNSSDMGQTEAEFVIYVKKLIRSCSFDPATKTFYEYTEYPNGTWDKTAVPNATLERIAYVSRFYGHIPME